MVMVSARAWASASLIRVRFRRGPIGVAGQGHECVLQADRNHLELPERHSRADELGDESVGIADVHDVAVAMRLDRRDACEAAGSSRRGA